VTGVNDPGAAGFDLDGVFDDDDYRYFYFNDENASDGRDRQGLTRVEGLPCRHNDE
jgi:hypothetical protein